jgi:calcineurin-like phosphoesterase family protein
MSKVYFTSDLHFGHASIVKFSGQWRKGSNSEEHDEWLIEEINKVVRKRDVLYILGDISMGNVGHNNNGIGVYNLSKVGRLNGTKKFILGNHDDMPIDSYRQYAQVIRGMDRYKGFWISHCPIHPHELRGRKNIHGHVHANSITKSPMDNRLDMNYVNVCVEANIMRNGTPIVEFEELKSSVGGHMEGAFKQ